MAETKVNIKEQEYWMDFERFEAEREWMKEKERELIPSFL